MIKKTKNKKAMMVNNTHAIGMVSFNLFQNHWNKGKKFLNYVFCTFNILLLTFLLLSIEMRNVIAPINSTTLRTFLCIFRYHIPNTNYGYSFFFCFLFCNRIWCRQLPFYLWLNVYLRYRYHGCANWFLLSFFFQF